MVAGHIVALASFFVQADPKPPVLRVNVLNLHPERSADASEAEHHEADQRPIAQAGGCGDVDGVKELARLCRLEH